MHFVKLHKCFLNLDHVTDVVFDDDGEATVYLDVLEEHACGNDECEHAADLEQGVRFFCEHSAALLRTYLDQVSADPRTPVPEVFHAD